MSLEMTVIMSPRPAPAPQAGGRPGRGRSWRTPQAHSVLLPFAVFSRLIDNNWEPVLSFRFDANLFLLLSFEAAQTE